MTVQPGIAGEPEGRIMYPSPLLTNPEGVFSKLPLVRRFWARAGQKDELAKVAKMKRPELRMPSGDFKRLSFWRQRLCRQA